MNSVIYALHGFLGKPSDWNLLNNLEAKVVTPSLYLNTAPTLTSWAEQFNNNIISDGFQHRILIGYSLGGRLALHAMIQNPNLWHASILVSTHPGLTTKEEKQQKHLTDSTWEERFQNDSWGTLMQDWNSQEIFGNDKGIERKESDYSRTDLVKMLRNYSLAHQENLLPKLAKLHIPTLFIAGEQDTKYATLANACANIHPKSQIWIAQEAGHRVPWQQTDLFIEKIRDFL